MILDTNALSAFFDAEAGLLKALSGVSVLHLPVIVIGEYRFGLRSSKLRKEREPKLDAFIETCTVMPILETTTAVYAEIRHALRVAGTPIPENDIWIAALAVEHHLPVATLDQHFGNVRRLKRVGW